MPSKLMSMHVSNLPVDSDPDEADVGTTSWTGFLALNGLLLVLGAIVLGLAFQWLDVHDPRILYNPWTYVVVVPIGLILISMILGALVSRIVERSMQATFLLSVLIHLVALSYAGSFVIFSRAWPDIFDSLAEERQRLKRQAIEARQYVGISRNAVTGQLPDYLRYVPTEHQPDHSALASQPASRSQESDPSLFEVPEPERPKEPSLSLMEHVKPRDAEHSLPNQSPQASAEVPLARRMVEQPYLGRIQPVELPAVLDEAADQPSELQQPETSIASQRRSDQNRVANPQPPTEFELPEFQSHSSPAQALALPNLPRSSPDADLPVPPVMDERVSVEIERSTMAGGVPGPAARSSQPIFGTPLLASQQPASESLPSTSLPVRRSRSDSPPTLSPVPHLGASQSSNWDAKPQATEGDAGRAVLPRVSTTSDGEAAASDVAALSGLTGDIQRTSQLARLPASSSPASESTLPELSSPQPSSELSTTEISPLASRRTRRGERQATVDRSSDSGTSDNELANSTRSSAVQEVLRSQQQILGIQSPIELNPSEDSGQLSARISQTPNLILPGRNSTSPEVGLADIDSVRLERHTLGGSIAPGTNTAVAKPAFQHRLERLDNPTLDPSNRFAPQSELAIERGLEFLARYQRADGSWRLQDFDTEVLIRSDTAATGLALLAFQGAGYTHLQSQYAKQVHRAIQFLGKHQKPNGDLYIPQDPASDQNAWLYSHSIAALALCEAYGMTQDERLRPMAQRAVDFMVQAQDAQRGGWRYRPGIGSDTSVSGWFMMALRSGKLAGLKIPDETFAKMEYFVEGAQAGPAMGHLYRYNPFALDTIEQRHGLQPTAVMTSVGLLMRLHSGWDRERPEMLRGARYLLEHSPQLGSKQQSLRDTYYWYYATQVIFHMGGDFWESWHESLYPLLIDHQVLEGPYKGSWSAMQPVPDLWARYGGRLYVTTMNLLSLEVSHRHLPLYEATAPE